MTHNAYNAYDEVQNKRIADLTEELGQLNRVVAQMQREITQLRNDVRRLGDRQGSDAMARALSNSPTGR